MRALYEFSFMFVMAGGLPRVAQHVPTFVGLPYLEGDLATVYLYQPVLEPVAGRFAAKTQAQ